MANLTVACAFSNIVSGADADCPDPDQDAQAESAKHGQNVPKLPKENRRKRQKALTDGKPDDKEADAADAAPSGGDYEEVTRRFTHFPDSCLLNDYMSLYMEKWPRSRDESFFSGAMQHGVPLSPSSVPRGFCLHECPSPVLGQIPRDDIIEELNNDDKRDVKLRRGTEIPHVEES